MQWELSAVLTVSVVSHMSALRIDFPSGALCEDSRDTGTNFILDAVFTLNSCCTQVTVRE